MSLSESDKPKTVRQHFVPQFYLRRFKDAGGALHVYKKADRAAFVTGERAVAWETGFYDFPPESLEDGLAEIWAAEETGEKLMRHFESELERGLNLLLSEGRFIGIQPDVKASLAFSITVQHLRTPSVRRDIAQQSESFFDALTRDMVETNFPGRGDLAPKIVFSLSTFIRLQIKALLDRETGESFAGPLRKMHWTLCEAPAGSSFVTSDNPVSRRNHLSHLGRTYSGMTSVGVEIVYPLSPAYALRLRERTHHRPSAASDRACVSVTPHEARRMNRIVAANAERFVIASSPDFEDIDRFFEANPELRARAWDRWTTDVGPVRSEKARRGKRRSKSTIETYIEPFPINWGGVAGAD